MTRKTYTVRDMHCANCAMRLESLEDELPGIVSIEASYRKGQVTVAFDESTIGEVQLLAAMEQLGYSVTV